MCAYVPVRAMYLCLLWASIWVTWRHMRPYMYGQYSMRLSEQRVHVYIKYILICQWIVHVEISLLKKKRCSFSALIWICILDFLTYNNNNDDRLTWLYSNPKMKSHTSFQFGFRKRAKNKWVSERERKKRKSGREVGCLLFYWHCDGDYLFFVIAVIIHSISIAHDDYIVSCQVQIFAFNLFYYIRHTHTHTLNWNERRRRH